MNVDVEDEVRSLIYGAPTSGVIPLGTAGSPDGNAHAATNDAGGADHGACGGTHQRAEDAAARSELLRDGELAAALLGELEPAAREDVLARAAAELARERRPTSPSRASPGAADRHECRPDLGAGSDLEAAAQTERRQARQPSIALFDPAAGPKPCYRVVIDGGSIEFSTCAPSARGAVAANVRRARDSVSAVNEAEPADRFSWRPDGSCECTPSSFTDCPSGGRLDAKGWCRECGLQVLPPRAALAATCLCASSARS